MLSQFESNLSWLQSSSPELYSKLISSPTDKYGWKNNIDTSDIDLLVDGKCIVSSFNSLVSQYYTTQRKSPDIIAIPSVVNDCELSLSTDQILAETVSSTSCTLLQHIAPSKSLLPAEYDSSVSIRNIICLGSLSLIPIFQDLTSYQNVCSLTLFESSLDQFRLFLGLIDLPKVISVLKQINISLSIHVDEQYIGLQDLFVNQFNRLNPFILHGTQIFRSPFPAPDLSKLHTWIHSPEGVGQLVTGMLGFTTDELNQVQQAIFNSKRSEPGLELPNHSNDQTMGAVLVSSGPSLDSNLPWLRDNQHHLFIIAAGSSIGSLLRNNITPDAVVLLERNQGVYELFTELLVEGHTLKPIDLFACSTVDPRIPGLFNKHYLYHRPFSASASLFHSEIESCLAIAGPQVINSTLEIALRLGFRNLLLFGCDFGAFDKTYPRSRSSLGVDLDFSSRSMQIPVKGNLGRTVFSSEDLLASKMLFERTVSSYPGLKLSRCGMGADFDSITVEEYDSPDDFTEEFLTTLIYSNIPDIGPQLTRSCSMQDVSVFLSNASSCLDDIYSDIKQHLHSVNFWSHTTSLFMTKYVSRVDALKYKPEIQFAVDLISQPVFMLAHDLYRVTPESSHMWSQYVDVFMSSFHKLILILQKYLYITRAFAQAEYLEWDPVVIKHLYSYYSNK